MKNNIEKQILLKINRYLIKDMALELGEGRVAFKNIRDVLKCRGVPFNPLFYVITCKNKTLLGKKELDYLIENSDLSFNNGFGKTALTMAIAYHGRQMLTEEHINKLIDCCPQNNKTTNDNCELVIAFTLNSHSPLKFSMETWKNLIEKTDKIHFNDEKMLLLKRILFEAQNLGRGIIDINKIAEKLDETTLKTTVLGVEVLYAAARWDQIELGVKIAEKIGNPKLSRCVKAIKDNVGGWGAEAGAISARLDKIINIINTTEIKEEIAKETKKNNYKNSNKVYGKI